MIAQALNAIGEHARAAHHLEIACELMPHDAFYHFELGEIYLKLKRFDAAIEQFEAAVLCAPLDDYYHVRLAAACVRVGNLDKAIQVMERAVKLRPRNASYRYLLAVLYENSGRPELAQPHRRFIAELDQYDLDCIRRFQTVWMGY